LRDATLKMPDLDSRIFRGSCRLSAVRGLSSSDADVKHTLWGKLHRPSMCCSRQQQCSSNVQSTLSQLLTAGHQKDAPRLVFQTVWKLWTQLQMLGVVRIQLTARHVERGLGMAFS